MSWRASRLHDRTEAAFAAWGAYVIRRRWWVLGLSLVATAPSCRDAGRAEPTSPAVERQETAEQLTAQLEAIGYLEAVEEAIGAALEARFGLAVPTG